MKRKITLCILLILIIMCVTLLSYEKINKTEISNDTGMFAIFLEEEKDSGKYQKSNLKTWPTEEEYTINMLKSYCENGSILRWNSETKKISLKVTGTDKCYVYFDKAEIGTEKHPHLIQTIEDLVRLSNDVNGGKTYAGEYFLLTNDLDFNDPSDYENPESIEFGNINGINGNEPLIKELTTGSGFVPIGEYRKNYFAGTFEGNNHTIENLYIARKSTSIGFIGWGYNLKIYNLKISGTIISNATEDSAGLVARADGPNTFENVISYLNLSNISGSTIGGFIGSNGSTANTTIINCQNYGNLVGAGIFVSGFVGWSGGNLTIKDSHNFANITNNSTYQNRIGSFLGADEYATNVTQIINSSNSGKIIVKNALNELDIGGFIGSSTGNIIIDKSFNLGDIEANTDSRVKIYASGIIGISLSTSPNVFLNTYNKGNIIVNGNPSGASASGFIWTTANNAKFIFVNCFNIGNMTAQTTASNSSYAAGITNNSRLITSGERILNNVYNSGLIEATVSYGIGILTSEEESQLQNVYFLANNVNGTSIGNSTKMEKNIMYSQTFVDTLNQNVESINLREIDESLKDYTLSKWKLGSDGYPTLDF